MPTQKPAHRCFFIVKIKKQPRCLSVGEWTNKLVYPGNRIMFVQMCSATSVMAHSLRPCGLYPARFLSPCGSSDKSTGVGCHALLQGIFPTQGLNPGLLQYRQITAEPPGNPNRIIFSAKKERNYQTTKRHLFSC